MQNMKERVGEHDRRSYGGGAVRAYDETEAERLVQRGLRALGLKEDELSHLPKGHADKCALACAVHARTMASHKWLTARLHMGHPQNLTAYIKHAPMIAGVSLARLMREA